MPQWPTGAQPPSMRDTCAPGMFGTRGVNVPHVSGCMCVVESRAVVPQPQMVTAVDHSVVDVLSMTLMGQALDVRHWMTAPMQECCSVLSLSLPVISAGLSPGNCECIRVISRPMLEVVCGLPISRLAAN